MRVGQSRSTRRYGNCFRETRIEKVSKNDRGICSTTTTPPPSFSSIEEFQNRLRHSEKLKQIKVAKNRRRKNCEGSITLFIQQLLQPRLTSNFFDKWHRIWYNTRTIKCRLRCRNPVVGRGRQGNGRCNVKRRAVLFCLLFCAVGNLKEIENAKRPGGKRCASVY